MTERWLRRVLLLAVTFCGVSLLAQDLPDLGPKLRDCTSSDCKCIQSSIDHNKQILEGYRELASSYKNMLTDLGDGKISPTWVDPTALSPSQIGRQSLLMKEFEAEEKKMVAQAPERDCGFPDDVDEIELKTSPWNGSPPSKADQEKYKPLFPCEQVYDAVMAHEYYHGAQWQDNNSGRNKPKSGLPRARTPYGQALEEAKGYEIEIAELEKLKKSKCGRAEGSVPDSGERLAQRQRLERAVKRVSAYAASIS